MDTKQLKVKEPLPGWRGRYFRTDNMTFAYYDFSAGASIHEHAHGNEESWHVIDGELEVSIDGETQVAGAGSVGLVPPDAPHSIRALSDGRAIVVDLGVRDSIQGIDLFDWVQIQASERGGVRFLECTNPITSTGDALEIVTACVENDTNLLLIDSSRLPDEFFDLSSGFAGEFLQKMQNYRVRVAAVIPADDSYSQRFREFLSEARTGRTFRTFGDRDSAEVWLTSE